MKKTSKDSTLDFFQKAFFFSKFELLNSECGLSACVYGSSVAVKEKNCRLDFIPLLTPCYATGTQSTMSKSVAMLDYIHTANNNQITKFIGELRIHTMK